MRILTTLSIAVFAAGPVLAQFPEARTVVGPAGKIWSERTDDRELWFRHSFKIAKPVRSASLVISCDDEFTLWVNGKQMAEELDWRNLVIVDIAEELRVDRNTIAVHGINNGGPGALVVWMIWHDAAGDRGEFVTDGTWRISDALRPGWESRDYDDTKWQRSTVHGETEYGKNVHHGDPQRLVYRSSYSQLVDDLEKELQNLRSAPDTEAATKVLDRLEIALMETRRKLWEHQKKSEKRRRPDK